MDLAVRAVRPPGRVPVPVRCSSARRSARRSTRSDRSCSARSSTSTRPRPRSSPLVFKYCDDNDLPLLDLKDLATTLKFLASRRGQADPGRLRRHVGGVGRGAAALDRRPRAGGRRHFFGEPEFDVDDLLRTDADGKGIISHPRAVGRHGPAAPVLDVHALDAGPAVRAAARGGRPAQAEAVLLLRRGAPAVRRRIGRAHGPDRAHGPAHPLEGRRRLLRDPGPGRRPVIGAGPARQPRSSTRSGRSRPTTPTTCARPPGPSR